MKYTDWSDVLTGLPQQPTPSPDHTEMEGSSLKKLKGWRSHWADDITDVHHGLKQIIPSAIRASAEVTARSQGGMERVWEGGTGSSRCPGMEEQVKTVSGAAGGDPEGFQAGGDSDTIL